MYIFSLLIESNAEAVDGLELGLSYPVVVTGWSEAIVMGAWAAVENCDPKWHDGHVLTLHGDRDFTNKGEALAWSADARRVMNLTSRLKPLSLLQVYGVDRYLAEVARQIMDCLDVAKLYVPDAEANGTSVVLARTTPTHSPDFTSVDWFGTRHQFSKGQQAECVRHLWAAWQSGTPTLGQEKIAELIDSQANAFRIAHVFRKHAAFGTMIVSPRKGVYALQSPENHA